MIKESVIYKIFIRYLKEKDMFGLYKKYVTPKYYSALESTYKISDNPCNLRNFMLKGYGLFEKKGNDEICKFNTFCDLYYHQHHFRMIIALMLKDSIRDYMKSKSIMTPFVKNLCDDNYVIIRWLDLNNIKEKDIKKHIDEIFDKFYNSLIENNRSISLLINDGFSWYRAKEGEKYWSNRNDEYIKFIKNKLLEKWNKKNHSSLKRYFLELQKKLVSFMNLKNIITEQKP